eukprot:1140487-Heterocapsa_arctica.AAC.1
MSRRSSSPVVPTRRLIVPEVVCWSEVLSAVESRLVDPSRSVVRDDEGVPEVASPGCPFRRFPALVA